MGKRGPAPAPTALKLVRGDRSSRINDNEPLPAPTDVQAPDWLPSAAREVWDRLRPDLTAKGVLTSWDVDAFADLCCLIVINRDALVDLDENGTTMTTVDRELSDGTVVYRLTKNPAWQVARESSMLLTSLGGRFGLNPSDRSALRMKDGAESGRGTGPERLIS